MEKTKKSTAPKPTTTTRKYYGVVTTVNGNTNYQYTFRSDDKDKLRLKILTFADKKYRGKNPVWVDMFVTKNNKKIFSRTLK